MILAARTLLLHSKRYCKEVIKMILWPYTLNNPSEKWKNIKVDKHGVKTTGYFFITKMGITIKHQHTCGHPFYILYYGVKNENTPGLTKWYLRSHAGIHEIGWIKYLVNWMISEFLWYYIGKKVTQNGTNFYLTINVETYVISIEYNFTSSDSSIYIENHPHKLCCSIGIPNLQHLYIYLTDP